jgi:hypothetical protein
MQDSLNDGLADFDGQQRNLPARGFRPAILLAGMGGIMVYGWYHLIVGTRERK